MSTSIRALHEAADEAQAEGFTVDIVISQAHALEALESLYACAKTYDDGIDHEDLRGTLHRYISAPVNQRLLDDVTEMHEWLGAFRSLLVYDDYFGPDGLLFDDWLARLASHVRAAGGEVPTND